MFKFPEQHKINEKNIVDKIFHSRDDFHRAVAAAYDQYRKGGYEPGTPTFVKMIVGSIKLNKEEWIMAKREIEQEAARIEKEKNSVRDSDFKGTKSQDESRNQPKSIVTKKMKDDAALKRLGEMDRVSGYSPDISNEFIEENENNLF